MVPPESLIVTPDSPAFGASVPALPIEASDGELLRLFAREPSDEAFARLIERHGAMVWRVCRQVLPLRHDAEDAYQATFLQLARRARMVRASESAAGWLYRVALRTSLAAKRRGRRRREAPLEAEPPAAETAFPDLAGRETVAALMDELNRLPAKYRTPLVLRYLEGRSRREIASQTDATIATVQGRLARGKAILRSRLLRQGVSLSAAMAVVAGSSANGDELAPARLISQTTGNATALATGGSLAASAAVMSLYREGVRVMLFGQAAKPAAAVAAMLVAATLLAAPVVDGVEPDASDSVVLDAEAPIAEEPPAAAVEIEAQPPSPPYAVSYYLSDLLGEEGGSEEAEAIIAEIENRVVLADGAPAEFETRYYAKNQSLVIAAPKEVHERIAGKLAELREASPAAARADEKQRLLDRLAFLQKKHEEIQSVVGVGSRLRSLDAISIEIGRVKEQYGQLVLEEAGLEPGGEDPDDGKSIEMSGSTGGEKQVTPPEDPLDEIKRLIQKANDYYDAADKIAAETHNWNDRARQTINLSFSNQASDFLRKAKLIAREYVSVEADAPENAEELIQIAEARAAEVEPLLKRITETSERQMRSLNLWNERSKALWAEANPEEARQVVEQPQAEAAVEPTPEEDPTARIRELLDEAEAQLQKAEALAAQVKAMRAAAIAEAPLSGAVPSGLVLDNVADLSDQKTADAFGKLKQARFMLANHIKSAMLAATQGEPQEMVKTTEKLQQQLGSLEERIKSLSQHCDKVMQSLKVSRQTFALDPSVTGSEWKVYDEPSPYNPHGWAVVAKMAPGGSAPIGPKDERGKRPELVFEIQEQEAEGFRPRSSTPVFKLRSSNGEIRSTFDVRSKVDAIEGRRFKVLIREPLVSGDEPDTSPYLSVVIRQLPADQSPAEK